MGSSSAWSCNLQSHWCVQSRYLFIKPFWKPLIARPVRIEIGVFHLWLNLKYKFEYWSFELRGVILLYYIPNDCFSILHFLHTVTLFVDVFGLIRHKCFCSLSSTFFIMSYTEIQMYYFNLSSKMHYSTFYRHRKRRLCRKFLVKTTPVMSTIKLK